LGLATAEHAHDIDSIIGGLGIIVVGVGEIVFAVTFANEAGAIQLLYSGFWAIVLALAVVAVGCAIHVIAGFL
jgi:hypothetical protein